MPYKDKEQYNQWNRGYKQRLRLEALSHYSIRGVIRCARCGNADIDVLCLDHIEGGGKQQRREVGVGADFYLWLRKNSYPEGLQVLCFNCNAKKYRQHQREERK